MKYLFKAIGFIIKWIVNSIGFVGMVYFLYVYPYLVYAFYLLISLLYYFNIKDTEYKTVWKTRISGFVHMEETFKMELTNSNKTIFGLSLFVAAVASGTAGMLFVSFLIRLFA